MGRFRQNFPNVPISVSHASFHQMTIDRQAFTASARSEAREHICQVLGIKQGHYAQFVFPVNRKNLFYEVSPIPESADNAGQASRIRRRKDQDRRCRSDNQECTGGDRAKGPAGGCGHCVLRIRCDCEPGSYYTHECVDVIVRSRLRTATRGWNLGRDFSCQIV